MSNIFKLSKNSQGLVPTIMTKVLKWTHQPNLTSFAGGMPDPNLFPLKEVTKAAIKVEKEIGASSLQYLPAQGHEGLKTYFQKHFSTKGISCSIDNIVPVCGVQQGIAFSSQIFLDSNDTILITTPTYFGALQVFDSFLVNYITIPVTENGLDLVRLETIFKKHRPKFFYVIPNFQNPSGLTIPEFQRPKIAALAIKYDIPIIEDDVFGDLYFDKPFTPIKSFAPEHTVYMTSLSKTLSSGFRLGFVVPPKKLTQKFIFSKQLQDVNLNTYIQHITYELCHNGTFERLLPALRKNYRDRKDRLVFELKQHCSDIFEWSDPKGGMFLWLRLKHSNKNVDDFLEYCSQKNLVFVPGTAFYPRDKGGKEEIRLSYSNISYEHIQKGVKQLAQCFKEFY